MGRRYWVHWTAGTRTPMCQGPYGRFRAKRESDRLWIIGIPNYINNEPMDREAAAVDEVNYLRSIVIRASNRA